jgi:hypothetical protein
MLLTKWIFIIEKVPSKIIGKLLIINYPIFSKWVTAKLKLRLLPAKEIFQL